MREFLQPEGNAMTKEEFWTEAFKEQGASSTPVFKDGQITPESLRQLTSEIEQYNHAQNIQHLIGAALGLAVMVLCAVALWSIIAKKRRRTSYILNLPHPSFRKRAGFALAKL